MSNLIKSPAIAAGLILGGILPAHAGAPLAIRVSGPGKPISPDLFGIFYEDINYAADGGLYAELIQNRSFEYDATHNPAWNGFTSWTIEQRGDGKGLWMLEVTEPIHANNPHYAILRVSQPGDGVGLSNEGFDGIPIKAGEKYDVSFFARQLYMNEGYGEAISIEGKPMPMTARLEGKDGKALGEVELQVKGWTWNPSHASITATGSDDSARFVLLAKAKGGIAIDHISLFPTKTFNNRRNGLRADLAQVIADLHPKFIRFPGGCVAHGMGIHNIYRWKDTIGPVEQRRGQKNFWNYYQSVGLGYFEYFQFCEDIGARPLPILAAGVSCPHSDQKRGKGQQCIPLAEMPAYIQDIMDLIEWANGPATSTWGAKRAQAGHPGPFGLKYLGIGNEDRISPEFEERFRMILNALHEKHPEITVIGTAGSQPDGEDFDHGWKFAREIDTPIVDEHYYRPPQWFFDNLNRYDHYDRKGPKVYAGEYAAQETNRVNTLRTALAEAAYMTALERNGDVVLLSSYAPLLAKQGHTQWRPDMIYFDNTRILLSANYHVQKLFGQNSGDLYLTTTVTAENANLPASCVKDTKTGDVILKMVNASDAAVTAKLDLAGIDRLQPDATVTVMSGVPDARNAFESPAAIVPLRKSIAVSSNFEYEIPAHSFSLIRIKTTGH
ncbi:MAG: alpha-N-arabinofuranosidase [Verrucomicrobia bacterium]|nr:alpha-N-arabinofuranosidase [Verrucomicrobiota bacterium]